MIWIVGVAKLVALAFGVFGSLMGSLLLRAFLISSRGRVAELAAGTILAAISAALLAFATENGQSTPFDAFVGRSAAAASAAHVD